MDDSMEAAAARAEEAARKAEEAAIQRRRAYTLHGPSFAKKARVEEAAQDSGSVQKNEALQKLQDSIAAAISTVSGSVMQQQQEELQAKAIAALPSEEGGESVQSFAQSTPQSAPPDMMSALGMSSAPAASSREPQYAAMKQATNASGDEDTVVFLRKHMQWMNREAGLKAVLEVEKVLNVAKYVEFGFNMKVLKDLEDKSMRVNDPTAYICAALRRVAGNESSPYNQVPKPETAGETAARVQQQIGAPFSAAAALGQAQDPMAAPSKVSQLFIPPQILVENPQLQQAYMLAEHAEQCARTASSAAAMYKTNANANPAELQALQETAAQASERVSWAVGWIDSYMPPSTAMPNVEMDAKEQWMIGVREIVKNAAILAAAASKTCTHW